MSSTGLTLLFSLAPVLLLVSLGSYVMYSYGLYKMAENTGAGGSVLAWAPILRLYVLGRLADRWENSLGKTRLYRIFLPLLRLGGWLLLQLALLASFCGWLTALWLLLLLSLGCLAASRILELLCYYKTFCDFEPEYSLLYFILCLLCLEWIPLFLCRNNVPVGIAGHCRPRQPRYRSDLR